MFRLSSHFLARSSSARLAVAWLCLSLFPDGVAAPVEHGLPLRLVRSVPAQEELEWCQPLTAGQVLRYRYAASQRLGFSLHYHLRQDGATLLRKDEIRGDEGEFRAAFAAEYCLRWQNYDDRSLRLEFEVR